MDLLASKLDELDCYWSGEGDRRHGLAEIIGSLPDSLAGRDALVVELCCADLEWRWRNAGSPDALDSGERMPGDVKSNGLQSSSQLGNYDQILDQVGGKATLRPRMLLAEWRARSAWGDNPNVQDFATQYAMDAKQLRSELDILAQLHVTVSNGHDDFVCPLTGQFEIGRQDIGELSPPFWDADSQRLLVSPLSRTDVSRRQLTVTRTRLREIELANTSRNVVILVQATRLPPGESVLATLPLKIQLGGSTVLLSCNFLPS